MISFEFSAKKCGFFSLQKSKTIPEGLTNGEVRGRRAPPHRKTKMEKRPPHNARLFLLFIIIATFWSEDHIMYGSLCVGLSAALLSSTTEGHRRGVAALCAITKA